MLQAYGPALELETGRSRLFWNEMRTLRMFQKTGLPLWRLSTAPSSAPKLVASIARKIDEHLVALRAGRHRPERGADAGRFVAYRGRFEGGRAAADGARADGHEHDEDEPDQALSRQWQPA